jgi:hypothetical protein
VKKKMMTMLMQKTMKKNKHIIPKTLHMQIPKKMKTMKTKKIPILILMMKRFHILNSNSSTQNPLQNSFIPGRSTKDNAIVLKEVLHFMRKSKRKNGDMVFKLDLEKAYDRVDWRFLRDTLAKFNFPPMIISLIMFGIASSLNTILWNRSKTEPFTPTRGLR